MYKALGQTQESQCLQTSPSSVPPAAVSNLHCSPGASSPNTALIPFGSDLANFKEGLPQLSMSS